MEDDDIFESEIVAPSHRLGLADAGVLVFNTVYQFATAATNSAELILDSLMAHANALRDEHDFHMQAAQEIEKLISPPKE